MTLHGAAGLVWSWGRDWGWVRAALGKGGGVKLDIQVLSWLAGGSALQEGLLLLEGGPDDSSVFRCVDPSSSVVLRRPCERARSPPSRLPFPSLPRPAAGGDLDSASASTLTWTPGNILWITCCWHDLWPTVRSITSSIGPWPLVRHRLPELSSAFTVKSTNAVLLLSECTGERCSAPAGSTFCSPLSPPEEPGEWGQEAEASKDSGALRTDPLLSGWSLEVLGLKGIGIGIGIGTGRGTMTG